MRWIRGLVPLAAVALMSAGPASGPPLLAVSDPPWEPPPCPAPRVARAVAPGAWYRLDGVQDASGTLAGMRLSIGELGGTAWTMELPAESFASGPADGLVLVGADDGTRSRLSLVDPARGCIIHVADEADVVRSALLSPDGATVWEHRVERETRADLGVWRRAADGGRATRQLPAPTTDAAYGRTFATELRWAPAGGLAVTSCGEAVCRTRILDRAGATVTTIGPTGPVVGVSDDGSVIAHEACGGLPCPLRRHAADGSSQRVVAAAGRAALAGDQLVFEADRGVLRRLDLASGGLSAVPAASGLVPLGGGSRATAGVGHRASSVLLAPEGRIDGRRVFLLDRGERAPQAVPGARR